MIETFGAIIRKARRDRERTLEQVAKAIQSHKGYVSGIENGKVRPPSQRITRKLCRYLGLDYQEMLALAWWEKRPKDLGILPAMRLLERIKNESALLRAEEEAKVQTPDIGKAADAGRTLAALAPAPATKEG
jgi:transcriptional regulator with XRE-family HTH domain